MKTAFANVEFEIAVSANREVIYKVDGIGVGREDYLAHMTTLQTRFLADLSRELIERRKHTE